MEEVESNCVMKSYDGRGSVDTTRSDGGGQRIGSISIATHLGDADAPTLSSGACRADGKDLWTASLVTSSLSAEI